MPRLLPVLRALPLVLLLAACSSWSPPQEVVRPRPGEALLQPCPAPQLVADPDAASDRELQLEKISIGQWGACNESRFRQLVGWVRRVLMEEKAK